MGETAMSGIDLIAEPGIQEVVFTRVFDAPRERVFRAYTDPKLIVQWWGPRSVTTTIDKMDARPGGQWRYLHQDVDGHEYAFHGVYHDVIAPERIVQTFEFEGVPGHVSLDTVTFEERDGKTTMRGNSVFQSVADRDGMVNAGMSSGLAESMDRLAELVESKN
jgi:uncharacterized protein YndB with AHSA1/START domain